MEIASPEEEWLRRQKHRSGGGWFRAEIEMDGGSGSIPRGPWYGFAAAVREPLVRLQSPKFDFEGWNWDYFAWPHDRLDANLEMRDSDPEVTLEADRKASESFLNQKMLQLEKYAMGQGRQEQHAAAWPPEQLYDNLEMRGSDPEALEAETKASESFLNSMLQLERYAMDQHAQEQNATTLPHNQLGANQGMIDCNRKETLEADQKASKRPLSRSSLLLKKREMNQEQQKESKLQTLEADQKASKRSLSLSRSSLLLKKHEMDQDQPMQEQHKESKLQTLEADQKASKRLLHQKRHAMDQDQPTQEQKESKHQTLEADRKAGKRSLSRSTMLLKRRREMDQDEPKQEQQKEPELQTYLLHDSKPVGRRSTRRRHGCAEANGILDHGRAMQGSWAC